MQFHNKFQKGQGLAEYTALVPFTIMLAIALSYALRGISGASAPLVPSLNGYGLPCEVEPSNEGAMTSEMGNHKVVLVSNVYDPDSNTTTVTYRVTSGASPSISHWTLGLPAGVSSNLVSVSEQYEIGTDPTTGTTGVKFDTGYEVEGDRGPRGNGRGNQDASKSAQHKLLQPEPDYEGAETVSRDVTMLFTGEYDFNEEIVSIKAGQDVYESVILAPVQVHDPSMDEDCG